MHQVMNLRDRKHEHARSGISDLSVAQAAVADQATPGEDQIGVDVVPARDAGDRGSGLQALRHDPRLLFARPETATLLFARPETVFARPETATPIDSGRRFPWPGRNRCESLRAMATPFDNRATDLAELRAPLAAEREARGP